jgi:RNA polymerase sigma-70 factor (ECF subfamily)
VPGLITTQSSSELLARIADGEDRSAWKHFDSRYRPIVLRLAVRLGLPQHDAEDAAQDALAAFLEGFRAGRYDREKGRLKNWLLGIARNKIADLFADRMRQPMRPGEPSTGDGVLAMVCDEHTMSSIWEGEWRAAVLQECLAQARMHFSSRDVSIFERLTVLGQPPDEIAESLAVSRNAVYLAKHRVLDYMRRVKDKVADRI